MTVGDRAQPLPVAGRAVEIDAEDRLGPRPDRRFDGVGVEAPGVGQDVDQHRLGADIDDRRDRGDPGHVGRDDFVAGTDPERGERQVQRRGRMRHADRVGDADIVGEHALEARVVGVVVLPPGRCAPPRRRVRLSRSVIDGAATGMRSGATIMRRPESLALADFGGHTFMLCPHTLGCFAVSTFGRAPAARRRWRAQGEAGEGVRLEQASPRLAQRECPVAPRLAAPRSTASGGAAGGACSVWPNAGSNA